MRRLTGISYTLVALIAVSVSLFHLYTAYNGPFISYIQRGIHLAHLLPLAFILYPATAASNKERATAFDWILASLAVAPSAYVILFHDDLVNRIEFVDKLTTVEMVLGGLAILLVIEAVRRAVSGVMALLIVIFLLYMPAGPFLPGVLGHQGTPFMRIIESAYLLTDGAMYGSLIGIAATYIGLFVIFGAAISSTGAGAFFTDFALCVAGGLRGGPAKIAVLSSSLVGSVTGSAVANVYTTGVITIPMMKKRGFDPQFAGAVEAVASTGGQLMPPVMGAAAFVLAQNVGVPYSEVMIAAAIPALLFYMSVWMMVHFRSLRLGIPVMSLEERPRFSSVAKKAYLFLPLILLFIMLVWGYSPLYAALFGIATALVLGVVANRHDKPWMVVWTALVEGGLQTVMISTALAGAGLIVISLTQTGLGLAFVGIVINLANGLSPIIIIAVALTALILGMGVPTTPAYVIASALAVPALLQLGFPILASHMFVFYFAIVSNITPPVAIAAYAAAGISGSKPLGTGVEAFLIAVTAYIIPVVFLLDGTIMLEGSVGENIISLLRVGLGIIALSAAIQGWFNSGLPWVLRVLLFIGAILLFSTSLPANLLGFAMVAPFLLKAIVLGRERWERTV